MKELLQEIRKDLTKNGLLLYFRENILRGLYSEIYTVDPSVVIEFFSDRKQVSVLTGLDIQVARGELTREQAGDVLRDVFDSCQQKGLSLVQVLHPLANRVGVRPPQYLPGLRNGEVIRMVPDDMFDIGDLCQNTYSFDIALKSSDPSALGNWIQEKWINAYFEGGDNLLRTLLFLSLHNFSDYYPGYKIKFLCKNFPGLYDQEHATQDIEELIKRGLLGYQLSVGSYIIHPAVDVALRCIPTEARHEIAFAAHGASRESQPNLIVQNPRLSWFE